MSEFNHYRKVCDHCREDDCGDATCGTCGRWWPCPTAKELYGEKIWDWEEEQA